MVWGKNYTMAAVSAICALTLIGSLLGGLAEMALKVTGHLLTLGMVVQKTWKIAGRAVEAYEDRTFSG